MELVSTKPPFEDVGNVGLFQSRENVGPWVAESVPMYSSTLTSVTGAHDSPPLSSQARYASHEFCVAGDADGIELLWLL
jgi:hypothetical protein